jgi:hypothetical protein
MKSVEHTYITMALFFTLQVLTSEAQISIPSDGSDGVLNIASNTVIDLSQAVTGLWDANNAANAGKGIYDPSKWAVVFKYSSVNIAGGATVSFKNHPTHAPVVWLINGNVTIGGILSLDGQPGTPDPNTLADPGPGGFRGGSGGQPNLGLCDGGGFGPGGFYHGGGVFNYGNPQLIPLIGGSGGSGGGGAGGGGGGAILIAASGNTIINGSLRSFGGTSSYGGSCGAIRLITDQLLGSGTIAANSYGPGRIRLESNIVSPNLSFGPSPDYTVPILFPITIWPPTNAPSLRLVLIGGQPVPNDPLAPLTAYNADLTTTTNSVGVILETSNFPTNGTVSVFIKPRNSPQLTLQASYVSGTQQLATWQVQATLPLRHTVIQARAVAP